jgi:hypothetical protein
MKGTGHFGLITLRADHASAKRHLPPVRAFILGSIPFIAAGEKEQGNLFVFIPYTGTAIIRYLFCQTGKKPLNRPGAFGRIGKLCYLINIFHILILLGNTNLIPQKGQAIVSNMAGEKLWQANAEQILKAGW